jgi:hypothetical protein
LPSITATQLLVVPRSMPMILLLIYALSCPRLLPLPSSSFAAIQGRDGRRSVDVFTGGHIRTAPGPCNRRSASAFAATMVRGTVGRPSGGARPWHVGGDDRN